MSSSRLPGKNSADIAGQPMLQTLFIRTSRRLPSTKPSSPRQPTLPRPRRGYCDLAENPFHRAAVCMMCWIVIIRPRKVRRLMSLLASPQIYVIDPMLIDDVVNTMIDGKYDFVCDHYLPCRGIGHILLVWMWKLVPSKFWRKRGKKPKNRNTRNMPCRTFTKALN